MIVGRGGTTTVFDLPAGHVLAGTAGPRCTFEQCGDPRAAPRGRRVAPSDEQTATVLGGPRGVRGVDPVAVPACRLHRSVTPAASVGAAAGRRELLLGLSTHPWRTGRARLSDRGQYRVVDSQASWHRSRSSPRRGKVAAVPAGAAPAIFATPLPRLDAALLHRH